MGKDLYWARSIIGHAAPRVVALPYHDKDLVDILLPKFQAPPPEQDLSDYRSPCSPIHPDDPLWDGLAGLAAREASVETASGEGLDMLAELVKLPPEERQGMMDFLAFYGSIDPYQKAFELGVSTKLLKQENKQMRAIIAWMIQCEPEDLDLEKVEALIELSKKMGVKF